MTRTALATDPGEPGPGRPGRGRHLCHAKGCTTRVTPRMFMCRPHWYMVPRNLRAAIWANYVPGQEMRKDPTPEYLEYAQKAVDAVARREGK